MSIEKLKEQLTSYVESNHPLIYIDTFEEATLDKIIKTISNGRKIHEWNFSAGIVNFDTKISMESGKDPNLARALENFNVDLDDEKEHIFVLKDASHFLRDPDVIARLRAIIQRIINTDVCAWIFIVSPVVEIPVEIEKFTTLLELALPDIDEITALVKAFVSAQGVKTAEEDIEELSLSLKGLSQHEISMLLYLSYQKYGHISKKNKNVVLAIKEQIIRKSNMMEMVPLKESLNDVGGLEKLKTWLDKKAQIFNDITAAENYGIEAPKGVMIFGMPGCGKSLSAKAAAHLFNVPLLRLDIGKLMGKYVGESEGNLRKAIKLAEAISPCVLWIDEIEKAFAGMGGDGGGNEVTTRLFGNFLTWMQEKTTPVFVIATANNLQGLPPELMRKGRFDELFFVDFPNQSEREAIFKIHLLKRKHLQSGIQLKELAKKTEGYCGADIESVVKESIEQAFVAKKPKVTMDDLNDVMQDMTPLREMLKDKITSMEDAVKRLKIKPAS